MSSYKDISKLLKKLNISESITFEQQTETQYVSYFCSKQQVPDFMFKAIIIVLNEPHFEKYIKFSKLKVLNVLSFYTIPVPIVDTRFIARFMELYPQLAKKLENIFLPKLVSETNDLLRLGLQFDDIYIILTKKYKNVDKFKAKLLKICT